MSAECGVLGVDHTCAQLAEWQGFGSALSPNQLAFCHQSVSFTWFTSYNAVIKIIGLAEIPELRGNGV